LTRFDEHFAFDSDEFEFLYTKKTPDSEESAWKKIVNKLRKHRAGQHDQSTHGGKSGFNVPEYVDLEGKRFSNEAVAEIRSKLDAYDGRLNAEINTVSDIVAKQQFGKPYSELAEAEQRSVNASRQDSNGNWSSTSSLDFYSRPTIRDVAKQNPDVKALKAEAENHYLAKDAMNQLAWNADGTLGPRTVREALSTNGGDAFDNFADRMRFANSDFRYTDKADYNKGSNTLKRNPDGTVVRENGKAVYETAVTTREMAEKIHAEEWKAFSDAAYPEVIVSNKGLRSILADGEFKTYTQIDRPARAGANDEFYKNNRTVYESTAFGYDNATDTSNRPVSGLLTAFTPHQDILTAYGNTQVILKPSVLARSTITPDDSLNGFFQPQTVSSFLSRPQSYANRTVAIDTIVNGKGYYTNRNRGSYNVPEIQIHGGVRVSDIASVVFRNTAPAALSTKLDSLGIPYEVETVEDAENY